MVALPLLSGFGATEQADLTAVYPINLEAVTADSGISAGYIRTAAGATTVATGPGIDRGGILYNGCCYRVMGTKLVTVDASGAITILADVGGSGPVGMDYGFGMLAIRSGVNLYYWTGTGLNQVTSPYLGQCLDVIWMDGYYVSTDGTSIVVTQLNDPLTISPLKYGSAEADPDQIIGIGRIRNELLAFGSNTIEFYTDQGGSNFPFQVSNGATIPVGCVGPQAKVRFNQTYAFVGGGRNQANGVWMVGSGTASKVSTRAIDDMIAQVADPSSIQLEARVSRDEQRLYVHLPDRTLVLLTNTSQATGKQTWYVAKSGLGMDQPYRLRNAVYAYGKWIVGDTQTASIGYLDDSTADHFGDPAGWQGQTGMLYNQGAGVIVHQLELVGMPGRAVNPETVFWSFTKDGETWTQERASRASVPGFRTMRASYSPHKRFRNFMGIRYRGAGLAGWATLNASIEPLSA